MQSSDAGTAPEPTSREIAERLAELRRRVHAAAARSGRGCGDVTVLCVTKTQSASVIEAAYAAGLRDFGENYVQEALAKQGELASPPLAGGSDPARWHLIGHLQSNKANAVSGRFSLIQSVDSLKLAERVGRAADALGVSQDILIQVKLGDEDSKDGIPLADAPRLVESVLALRAVRLRGVMAIAPLSANGSGLENPRHYFAQARHFFEQLPDECRHILSMGMSGDFEPAVEEGATLIRVGTTLLGRRPPKETSARTGESILLQTCV